MSKMIQVRNVPARLHRELTKRARARGKTLTDYIQDILEREMSRPPADEVFERIASRQPVDLGHHTRGAGSKGGGVLRPIVLDASAVVEYLLKTKTAEAIRTTIEAPDMELHVPALCDLEVAATLRRALLASRMTEERARFAMMDYLDLPITRHAHQGLLPRIVALRFNFSAYDATYVVLAERLGAELLTADRALASAATAHTEVTVLRGW
jgi:predicted nucleic acid-binding protein/plasmid stability protein